MSRKAALVWALVLLSLAAAGGFWAFARTPRYALYQARRALLRHDLAAFERHVDMEAFARSYAEQLSELLQAEARSRWGAPGGGLGLLLMDRMKPRLESAVKKQMARLVREGRVDASGQAGPMGTRLDALWSMTGGGPRRFAGFAHVRESEGVASAGLRFVREADGDERVLEVRLEKRGGRWRVAGLGNLAEFLGSPPLNIP